MAATVAVVTACTKTSNYKEKTEAERSADYHKYLSTPDLSLFELRGNVRREVLSNGIESYFSAEGNTDGKVDTVCFSAGGLCEAILMSGGDTLVAIRNTEGKIVDFFKTSNEEIAFSFSYDIDGLVAACNMAEREVSYEYEAKNRCGAVVKKSDENSASKQLSPRMRIKILSPDGIGNWTRREIFFDNKQSGSRVEKREIFYY